MLNKRNHRKIVVVDGVIGFTDSMNIGDVYAGLGANLAVLFPAELASTIVILGMFG